jgi:site-specific DNA-methyltransferase (adenine-specific)
VKTQAINKFYGFYACDPAHNNLRNYKGRSFEFERITEDLFKAVKEGGVVVWVVGDKINGGGSPAGFRQGIYFQEIGFNTQDAMIYDKKNTLFTRFSAYADFYEKKQCQ